MARYPALPLWTDALVADTTHLSRDEFGVYMLLLIAAWRRPNCDLPDDDKFLAAVSRCDGRKWKHMRPVMAQFHTISDGVWKQNRLQKERKYVDDLSAKQRENVNVRWNKNKGLGDTTVIPNGYQTDTPIPIPIPIKDIISNNPPLQVPPLPKPDERKYFFAGRVIRLTHEDAARWRENYPLVPDLRAELEAADSYYATNAPKKGKLFFAVSNWLKKANAAAQEKREEERRARRSFN